MTDFLYFGLIYKWLTGEIETFSTGLVGRSMQFVTSAALLLVTLWILIQGFRILTGRSRDSMMSMVVDMSRIGVIVAAATVMAVGSIDLQKFLGADGLGSSINQLVTGSSDSVTDSIDRNLAYTQLAMAAIEAVPVPSDDIANSAAQSRASFIAALGVAGPPMTAGAMLLMYQVAMALFIGFGPLFILCLIFEQTKSFFSRWLMYGLTTLFSMAVLNFMVSIVMKLTLKVAIAMWSASVINGLLDTNAEGFNNQSMQQGGIGLLMTVLLITAPSIAATFFGGTLGQFYTQSAIGGGGAGQQRQSVQGPDGLPARYGGGMPASSRAESGGVNRSGQTVGIPRSLGDSTGSPSKQDVVKTSSNP